MKTVNIHAAKTHLSALVEDAAAGEEIVIAKAGKPLARLVPLEKPDFRKTFGILKRQNSDGRQFRCAIATRDSQGLWY